MNEPLDERLRRDLSRLDDLRVRDVDAVQAAASAAARRHRRNRRSAAAVASLALVVGVVIAVGAHHGSPGTASDTTAATPTTSPVDTVAPSTSATPSATWTPLPPDPRGVVFRPAVVWTGTEAIVLGGVDINDTPVGGAVAYRPATNSWARLAEPLTGARATGALAVWTGHVLLVIGGDGPTYSPVVSAGQAFDPTTDTWRYIAPPLAGVITDRSPFAWTGKELLVWPGGGDQPVSGEPPIAYDPVADAWRSLPSAPVAQRQSAASVWTGTEWIVWGGTTGTAELSDGAAYNPTTGTWRTLARSPLSGRRVGGLWTGTEMLVDAGSSGGDPVTGNGALALADGAAYDPATDRWRTISRGPAHPGFVSIWTGTYAVMFAKGGGVVYDVAADRWLDCCQDRGPLGVPVWTGSEALVLGGGDASTGGAVFRLPG